MAQPGTETGGRQHYPGYNKARIPTVGSQPPEDPSRYLGDFMTGLLDLNLSGGLPRNKSGELMSFERTLYFPTGITESPLVIVTGSLSRLPDDIIEINRSAAERTAHEDLATDIDNSDRSGPVAYPVGQQNFVFGVPPTDRPRPLQPVVSYQKTLLGGSATLAEQEPALISLTNLYQYLASCTDRDLDHTRQKRYRRPFNIEQTES